MSIDTRRLARIKNEILGKNYVLSLVFIGNKKSISLNSTYRNKQKAANVLSFPLSQTEGEIFINVPLARREARQEDTTLADRVTYLFIHGILHLKGYAHGRRMDTEEKRLSKKFL